MPFALPRSAQFSCGVRSACRPSGIYSLSPSSSENKFLPASFASLNSPAGFFCPLGIGRSARLAPSGLRPQRPFASAPPGKCLLRVPRIRLPLRRSAFGRFDLRPAACADLRFSPLRSACSRNLFSFSFVVRE